jgi:hypothetical protein
MKNRFVVTAMVLGASMGMTGAMYAAPAKLATMGTATNSRAMYGKEKMVSFSLHNGSAEVIKVKAGETEMTLEPGKTMAVKLPTGMQLIAEETSTHYAAGSVLAVVSDTLSDATITLK